MRFPSPTKERSITSPNRDLDGLELKGQKSFEKLRSRSLVNDRLKLFESSSVQRSKVETPKANIVVSPAVQEAKKMWMKEDQKRVAFQGEAEKPKSQVSRMKEQAQKQQLVLRNSKAHQPPSTDARDERFYRHFTTDHRSDNLRRDHAAVDEDVFQSSMKLLEETRRQSSKPSSSTTVKRQASAEAAAVSDATCHGSCTIL